MSSELCNPLLYMEIMKRKHPEIFTEWCCTELSHVLDFSGTDGLGQVLMGEIDARQGKTIVKKFSRKKKTYDENYTGSIFGAPLSEKGFFQARQLIEHLKNYIDQEGIFRIPGNSARQQKLRDRLDAGAVVDLASGEFSANDVACVLKTFLGDLPEPLVTDRQYQAHREAAGLTYKMGDVPNLTPGMRKKHQVRCLANHIKALKYLFFLLPSVNFKLLKELLALLKNISEHEENNKMTTYNLGIIFAPHIVWPRYFTTEDLRDQERVKQLNYSVEFMIEHFYQVFNAPSSLLNRCEEFVKGGQLRPEGLEENSSQTKVATVESSHHHHISKPQVASLLVTNTKENTANALSQLYAEVQAMPPGPKKRKLMKQFAKSSHLPNTPDHIREDLVKQSHMGYGHRRRTKSVGESLMKQVSTPFHHKKKRAAPPPPENAEEAIKQFKVQKNLNNELAQRLPSNPEAQRRLRQRTKSATSPPVSQRTARSYSVPSPSAETNTAIAMLQGIGSNTPDRPIPKRPAPKLEDSPAYQGVLRSQNTPLGKRKKNYGKRPVPAPRTSTPVEAVTLSSPKLPQPLAEPSRPRPSPRKAPPMKLVPQSYQTDV